MNEAEAVIDALADLQVGDFVEFDNYYRRNIGPSRYKAHGTVVDIDFSKQVFSVTLLSGITWHGVPVAMATRISRADFDAEKSEARLQQHFSHIFPSRNLQKLQ